MIDLEFQWSHSKDGNMTRMISSKLKVRHIICHIYYICTEIQKLNNKVIETFEFHFGQNDLFFFSEK